jgi:hypothetical protein
VDECGAKIKIKINKEIQILIQLKLYKKTKDR